MKSHKSVLIWIPKSNIRKITIVKNVLQNIPNDLPSSHSVWHVEHEMYLKSLLTIDPFLKSLLQTIHTMLLEYFNK